MIRLRQTTGADQGRELELDQDLIRIGRMPDSDVNFDPEVDLDASGRHAEIRNEHGRYLLIDTGSRNGTWLNGQRIKHAALGEGDEIEFGRGGPRLLVEAMESRSPSRELSQPSARDTALRDPRFDPLALPVTTATRLEDLVARGDSPAAHDHPPASSFAGRPRNRRHARSSALLWSAAGILLLSALILIATSALD